MYLDIGISPLQNVLQLVSNFNAGVNNNSFSVEDGYRIESVNANSNPAYQRKNTTAVLFNIEADPLVAKVLGTTNIYYNRVDCRRSAEASELSLVVEVASGLTEEDFQNEVINAVVTAWQLRPNVPEFDPETHDVNYSYAGPSAPVAVEDPAYIDATTVKGAFLLMATSPIYLSQPVVGAYNGGYEIHVSFTSAAEAITYFHDTFTGANETVSSRTPDTGAYDEDVSREMTIVDGYLTESSMFLAGIPKKFAVDALIELSNPNTQVGNGAFAIEIRSAEATPNTYLYMEVYFNNTDPITTYETYVTFYDAANDTYIPDASTPRVDALSAQYALRYEVYDDAIVLKLDGQTLITVPFTPEILAFLEGTLSTEMIVNGTGLGLKADSVTVSELAGAYVAPESIQTFGAGSTDTFESNQVFGSASDEPLNSSDVLGVDSDEPYNSADALGTGSTQ